MIRKTDSGKSVYLPLGEAMEFGYTIKDESKSGAINLRYRIFSLIGIVIFTAMFYSIVRSAGNPDFTAMTIQVLLVPVIFLAVHLLSILNPSNVTPYSRKRDGKLQFKTRSVS